MFGNKLQKLENKSSKAVSVFQEAISGLEVINREVEKEMAVKSQKISKLEFELGELTVLRAANNRAIEKFELFLE
jgi:hypothetical protein